MVDFGVRGYRLSHVTHDAYRHDRHTARMRQSVGTEKRPMMFSRGGPTLSTRSSPFDCSLWIFLGWNR
jgi:hypothetical protein